MRRDNKKDFLLYRKENRKPSIGRILYKKGSKYKYSRKSKDSIMKYKEGFSYKESMKNTKSGNITDGYDYTPLFMFLLKNIGKDFDLILKDINGRINSFEPLYWIVDKTVTRELIENGLCLDYVRIGECSSYSRLWIDEENKLQKVNPKLSNRKKWYCGFTETHNGKNIGNE